MSVGPEVDFLQSARVQSPKSFLFSTLIKDLLGISASLVIAKLYSKGKLTLKELIAKTRLGKKKVLAILVTLIQLKCVRYISNDRGNVLTYYIDEEGCLLFLYAGEIISTIKQRYNDEITAEIVQNFLSYGNLTLSDYLNNFESYNEEQKTDVGNKFSALVHDGWLIPIKSGLEFQNKHEIYSQIYKQVYARYPKGSNVSEVKRKKEVKLETEEEFNKLFTVDPQDIYETNGNSTSATLNHFASSKINSSNGNVGTLKKLKKDVSFKFSINRFLKSLRTNHLVKLVNQRLGSLTSKIFEVILRRGENNSPDCFRYALDYNEAYLSINSFLYEYAVNAAASDIPAKSYSQYLFYVRDQLESKKHNCFTLQEIAHLLKSKDINLLNSIKFTSVQKQKKRKLKDPFSEPPSKKVKHEVDDLVLFNGNNIETIEDEEDDFGGNIEEEELSESSDPKSIGLIHQHIKLLLNCSIPFLKQNTNGTYFVPFSLLIPKLKEFEYLYFIKSVVGLTEFKILNCIIKSKLIDEKTLINKTLVSESDVRVCVNNLFKVQAIEVQEIPKTMDRQANRSAFAYRFNTKFSSTLIENNLLHEMALLFTNINDIKEKNKMLLSKVNRDDIKGRESELLLTSELNQLKWLNEKELNCIARIHRARSIWEVFAIL